MDKKPAREEMSIEDQLAEAREGEIAAEASLVQLLSKYRELEGKYRETERKVSRDALTDLGNREHFDGALRGLNDDRRKKHSGYCVLAFDLDGFKGVNDNYGHPVGDDVLCKFADVLRETIRESDDAVRTGGDEFFVILRETDAGGACTAVKHIKENLDRVREQKGLYFNEVGFSAGVAYVDGLDLGDVRSEYIASVADRALIAAKKAGKNCVGVYHINPEEDKDDYLEIRALDE
jgi:diguanylate cyclase (GGDEF)-like protein